MITRKGRKGTGRYQGKGGKGKDDSEEREGRGMRTTPKKGWEWAGR